MPSAGGRIVVIGVGNPDRGDDAAGRLVARRLRGILPADIEVIESDGEATTLLALLDGADCAILIDACISGARAGTVHRFDVNAAPLPEAKFSLSTHGFGLGEAVELARALGQLPPRSIVYAIEGLAFEMGSALSPQVATAIEEASELISAEIADGERGMDNRLRLAKDRPIVIP